MSKGDGGGGAGGGGSAGPGSFAEADAASARLFNAGETNPVDYAGPFSANAPIGPSKIEGTAKQQQLARQLVNENAPKVHRARAIAERLEREGKPGAARRTRAAAADLEKALNRSMAAKEGGPSLWIDITTRASRSSWLDGKEMGT